MPRARIACDQAELVVDCVAAATSLGVDALPSLETDPWAAATSWLAPGEVIGIALSTAPSPERLLSLATAARRADARVCAAFVADVRELRDLARDVGIVAVRELRALLGAMALVAGDASAPWRASTRTLSDSDQSRLDLGGSSGGRTAHRSCATRVAS